MSKATKPAALELQTAELKNAAMVFRAVNNPLRQKLLSLIHQRGRPNVTSLYKKLRIEQSVTSQHLAILRNSGIVNADREGKFIFYSVNYKRLKDIHVQATNLLDMKGEKPAAKKSK